MAYSSILGADRAAHLPSGRDADLLGPSDSSDSGSDAIGSDESHADSDAAGTGERGAVAGRDAREGADILPDRVIEADEAQTRLGGEGFPAADIDARAYSESGIDLDADADLGDDEGAR